MFFFYSYTLFDILAVIASARLTSFVLKTDQPTKVASDCEADLEDDTAEEEADESGGDSDGDDEEEFDEEEEDEEMCEIIMAEAVYI